LKGMKFFLEIHELFISSFFMCAFD